MCKISIIVPVYYNEENLLPLYADLREKVVNHLGQDSYEIVMVDDGSKDRSYEVMEQLAKIDSNIRIAHLSRNFGEHAGDSGGIVPLHRRLCGSEGCRFAGTFRNDFGYAGKI